MDKRQTEEFLKLLRQRDDLQAENVKLQKALTLACTELADHDCPHEFDLAEWTECTSCEKDTEIHYNTQRDIDCWKRYFVEKVEGGEVDA